MKRVNAICTLVLAILAFPSLADPYIASSAEETQPLQAGDRAPGFTVYEVDGT